MHLNKTQAQAALAGVGAYHLQGTAITRWLIAEEIR